MLHFGPVQVTGQALAAIAADEPDDASVFVLGNGEPFDTGQLGTAILPKHLVIEHSPVNLGFAGGMNHLLARVLADDRVDRVLLLNNDAQPLPGAIRAMLAKLDQPDADHQGSSVMVAARLMRTASADMVDSLGITLYRSGLASNRQRPEQKLLGPTGGCMLLHRRLLDDLLAQHGYWFDERFFLYAEDTDLVMRARWLGHVGAYADEALVLHHGSQASGGPDNAFVLYHGIRNSIWALAKNAPALWLLLFSPWIVLAHGGIVLRQLRKGRARTLWRLYRDALRGLPAMWRERVRIRRNRRVPAAAWWSWVEPRLYDGGYLRNAWSELFTRRR